ncbi:MAG: hypothetical protein HKN72_17325 [Gemmatimonadetes bacterium]|nr:hypothetical protein [Gemmatimonadota bacterium]
MPDAVVKTPIPWIRVVAEGFVIVVSILMAFGIEAWWQGRQEGAQALDIEQAALESMLADLAADTSEVRGVLDYARIHDRAAATTLHMLQGTMSADSIGYVMLNFMYGGPYNFQRSGFVSLRSADRLSYITNHEIRAASTAYFDKRQPELDRSQALELERRVRLLTALSAHVRWPIPPTSETSWPVEGPVVVVTPWADFRSSNQVAFRLQDFGGLSHDVWRYAETVLQDNAALRDLIEGELARRW